MSSETIATVVKMLESLPDSAQIDAAEYLRKYIAEVQDEMRWEGLFRSTESKLVTLAREAKQQIVEGKAQPMNFDGL